MKIRSVFVSVLIAGLSIGVASPVQEQKFDINQLLPQEVQGVLGLKELLTNAQNNYNLIAKNDGVSASQANKTAAYLEFGPTVSAGYSYEYQDPSLKGNRGKYNGENSANVKLNLELYGGFRTMNKVREKEALHRVSIADRDYTEQNLYLQIIQQYYAYFTNYSNLVSLKQKKTLLQSNVERLEKLYTSGLTTIDDLESLKAEASLTDYQIAQKELEVEENRLNLSLLTNTQVVKIRRDTLQHPDISAQKERADITLLREQATSIGYKRKQMSYAPTINLYDTFTYADTFGDFSSKNKTQNTFGISISMSFDSGVLFKQREALGLQQMQSFKELAYKQEEQKKEITFYKKSLDIAKAKVKSAEAGLKSAVITFENVSKRYDAQLINYVDYLNALSQKFNAEATYVESLNNYEMQKANFAFYSGQDLKTYVK